MKKKTTKKRFLKKQDFDSLPERWAHIISCIYENRKRICAAGFDNTFTFQLGGETFVIKGK